MDAEKFGALVREQKRLLYHIAYTMLRSDADALDAVQEALLAAWKARDTLRDAKAFRAWLARILVNTCHDVIRRRRPTLTLVETIPAPVQDDSSLEDALALLSEELRLPVVMHYIEGFAMQEIAEMLDIPANTVKNRLYRARLKLRGLLEEEEVYTHA